MDKSAESCLLGTSQNLTESKADFDLKGLAEASDSAFPNKFKWGHCGGFLAIVLMKKA